MLRFLMAFFGLLPSFLLGNTSGVPAVEVASDPSMMIYGCVNAMTGNYSEGGEPLSFMGAAAYTFQYRYNSGDGDGGSMTGSWWHNLQLSCRLRVFDNRDYAADRGNWYLETLDELGVYKMYHTGVESWFKNGLCPVKRDLYATPSITDFKVGYANTAFGEIAGKNHLANETVFYHDRSHTVRITQADGTTDLFVRNGTVQDRVQQNFGHSTRILPHGMRWEYLGAAQGNISGIEVRDANGSPTGQNLTFSGDSTRDGTFDWRIDTHDGRWVRFKGHTVRHGAQPQIHEISSSNAPTIAYAYKPSERVEFKEGKARYIVFLPEKVIRRDLPEGRFLKIDYYVRGINYVAGREIRLRGEDRLQLGKVQRLLAPTGPDADAVALYEFLYEVSATMGGKSYAKLTTVLDAQGHKKCYGVNKQGRLEAVFHFLGAKEHTHYSTERLIWGEGRNVCDLSTRVLEEADGTVRSCQHYGYDGAHNPIEESSWGNLSGHCAIAPSLEKGRPVENGCECYTIRRSYSEDAFRNKIREEYPNGFCSVFHYKPKTNLCTAILSGSVDSILQRTFHRYDDNGVLVETIEDDGAGSNSEDLSAVTYRRITRLCSIQDATNFGLPSEVARYYLDLSSQEEVFVGAVRYQYSREGWVTEEAHYDAQNELSFTIRREFDSMGNVLLEQDGLGQITCRRYDANGNKIWEQGPDSDYHLEFQYDFSNRPISEEVVLRDGTRYVKSFRYDHLNNKVAEIDIHGHETRYEYDDLYRLIATHRPTAYDGLGQELTAHVQQQHDIAGNVTSTTDALGHTTCMTHTIRGQVVSIAHPDGRYESKRYNLNGTVEREIAPNGSYTIYTYDLFDRVIAKEFYSAEDDLLSTSSFVYKGELLLAETDANGNTTSYEYDCAGRRIGMRTETSYQQVEYDALGRPYRTVTWVDEENASVSVKEYDVIQRVIEERIEDLQGKVYKRTAYSYDHRGNRTEEVHFTADGPVVTHTDYDALGRIVCVVDPKGNKTITDYNDWFVNEQGQKVQQVTVTDALGRQTVSTRNAWDQPVCVLKKDSFGIELSKHQLGYSNAGHLTQRVDTVKALNQPDRNLHTQWMYDCCGRCIELEEAVGTHEARVTRTLYNGVGEKEAIVYQDGTILKYEYDAVGRLVRYWSSDDSISYTYRYDAAGNVLEIRDEIHRTSTLRSYDSQGHVCSEQLAHQNEVRFDYDGLGRMTRYSLPDESSVTYEYDTVHLTKVSRVSAQGETLFTHEYTVYDLSGRCLEEQLIGQLGAISTQYDACGRQTSYVAPGFSELVSEEGYDAIGNLLQKQRTDLLGPVQCSYSYDALNQLILEEGVQTHRYLFDSMNNRLQVDDDHCEVNALNQLLTQGAAQYHYDSRGNRVSDGENTYDYDVLGRLIRVHRGELSWVYQYDGFNRRVLRRSYQEGEIVSEEYFLYQGKNEVGVLEKTGQLTEFRMLGKGKGAEIGAAVLIQTPVGTYAPLHDHSGHVVALIDTETGKTQEVLRYSAFGVQESYNETGEPIETSCTKNPWRFASKRYDEETGFLNFGRRFYDPNTARWLTPDPKGFDDGPNLYAYVHNSPLTHFDEYGLFTRRDRRNRNVQRFRSISLPRRPSPIEVARRGCRALCRQIGRGVEGLGRHCLLPHFQGPFVAAGRCLQGYGLSVPPRYACDHCHSFRLAGTYKTGLEVIVATGQMTTYEDAVLAAAEDRKDLDGMRVTVVYNSTYGLLSDSCESGTIIAGYEVKSVGDFVCEIRQSLARVGGVGSNGRVYIKVHSQAGAVLNKALGVLQPSELGMIDVVTFGSAKLIHPKGLGSCVNYVSRCDFVSLIGDPIGYCCALLGFRPDVKFIGPRFANPLQEHRLHNKTYRERARNEARNWLNKQGG